MACQGDGDINCQVNKRASYISGQTIYGDELWANIGYTRRDSELHTEYICRTQHQHQTIIEHTIPAHTEKSAV